MNADEVSCRVCHSRNVQSPVNVVFTPPVGRRMCQAVVDRVPVFTRNGVASRIKVVLDTSCEFYADIVWEIAIHCSTYFFVRHICIDIQ